MQFCPKCGVMLSHKVGIGKFVCSKCGYESAGGSIAAREKMAAKIETGIVKKEHEAAMPITEARCKKCSNNKAYFWSVQTRAGDEGETSFFKCTKCNYTWRQYR